LKFEATRVYIDYSDNRGAQLGQGATMSPGCGPSSFLNRAIRKSKYDSNIIFDNGVHL